MNDGIPCKDCLILGLCRSIRVKRCSLLHGWVKSSELSHTDMWTQISKYLPNLGAILRDDGTKFLQ